MSENQAADYEQKPDEQYSRWTQEFAAARKPLEAWQKRGDTIDAEFRNEMGDGEGEAKLPLFTADTQTMIAMLFGQVPKCDVSRRFGDADDDLGRVAGEILERVLNTDVSRDGDTYVKTLKAGLMDFFLPGFTLARARYVTGEIESEEVEAETDPDSGKELVEAYTKESRPKEDVEFDYVHWKDWLWGPAKVVHLVPWWALRVQMSREKLVERFGPKGKLVPLKKREDGPEDPWSRADIWEIHEKDARRVYWFCETYPEILDTKEDPLQLEGFYPFPEPLVANLTTSKVVPRPYYALHQDQYRHINKLMTRKRELVDAIRASGLGDAENYEQLQRLLMEESRNKLIPIKNWGKFTQGGGIQGSIEWFPLEMVVNALQVTNQELAGEIDLLHQTTGFADIMRGEATQAGATATEQRVKSRTGSVRAQRLQDLIAEYATNLLRIKAEIVCKHFTPETISARANVKYMPEADRLLAPQAIALLKSDFACYRIEVKPEAVALADFAAMKAERSEVLETLTTFFMGVAPIVQAMPDALEDMLELAKWVVAGVRGSSQAEGAVDRMVGKAKAASEARKNAPQQAPPPNPQVQAEQAKQMTVQLKGQTDIAKIQAKAQSDQATKMVEVQADQMREANQREENVKEAAQRQMVTNALKPPPAMPTLPGRPAR